MPVRDVRDGVSSSIGLPGEERMFGVRRGDDPIDVLIGDRARGGGKIGLSLLRIVLLRVERTSVGSGMLPIEHHIRGHRSEEYNFHRPPI